jgi:hypothetical protein
MAAEQLRGITLIIYLMPYDQYRLNEYRHPILSVCIVDWVLNKCPAPYQMYINHICLHLTKNQTHCQFPGIRVTVLKSKSK